MFVRLLSAALLLAAVLSSPIEAKAQTSASSVSSSSASDYLLGVNDHVKITVFGEPTLSGEFLVGSSGTISLPLVGDVYAQGSTISKLGVDIQQKLAAGYIRDPRVSVEVTSFRPFYILGEVTKPGEYPYSTGLTVLNAVATAQGFTYRAEKRRVFVKHAGEAKETSIPMTASTPVEPGDTIRVGERYF
jgi:protein involved in polysaccharide export with SLBB domain